MEFEIRQLLPPDAEASVALRREMLIDQPVSFLGTLDEDGGLVVDVVRERLGHSVHRALGAFDRDGTLVSTATFIRQEPAKIRHKGLIVSVYTTPKARRKGLSRRLIEELIEYARGLGGVELLGLGVSAEAPAAHALYRSLGFVDWGREPRAIRTDGRDVDEIHMWRTI